MLMPADPAQTERWQNRLYNKTDAGLGLVFAGISVGAFALFAVIVGCINLAVWGLTNPAAWVWLLIAVILLPIPLFCGYVLYDNKRRVGLVERGYRYVDAHQTWSMLPPGLRDSARPVLDTIASLEERQRALREVGVHWGRADSKLASEREMDALESGIRKRQVVLSELLATTVIATERVHTDEDYERLVNTTAYLRALNEGTPPAPPWVVGDE